MGSCVLVSRAVIPSILHLIYYMCTSLVPSTTFLLAETNKCKQYYLSPHGLRVSGIAPPIYSSHNQLGGITFPKPLRGLLGLHTCEGVGLGLRETNTRSTQESLTSPNEPCAGRAIARWAFIFIRVRFVSHTSHRFFVATLRFDHDRQPPTTKGPKQGALRTEHGHRWSQFREGGREHYPSEPCLWIRGCPSHHDPGEFLSLPR